MTAELFSTAYGSAGPRITFLHGLFGQGKNWTTVAKALRDDFRVTLVDLPNHGRSAWTSRFDYVAMAEAVASLLTTQDLPGTVVGHSMGGKVAMILALRHPELVQGLVVVDIAPIAYGELSSFADYVAGMRGLDLHRMSAREQADEALTAAVPDPAVRAFLLQNLRRDAGQVAPEPAWRWQMNLQLLGDHLAELAGWPAIEAPPYPGPVLWLAGARSAYVTSAAAGPMRALFPRAQLVRVKDAGHWVHADQPEVFTSAVRRFAALPAPHVPAP